MAYGSRVGMIKKFQRALGSINYPVVYHTTQFFNVREHRPITQYHIKKVIIDEEAKRSTSEEMFSTYYQQYVIFFLNDVWTLLNGRELDTSNVVWQEYKQTHNINVEELIA